MLAAQGYQESQLNQSASSHVGDIGVMQLMLETGAQMKVGDIKITEANIHAGAKYMDMVMSKYFPEAKSARGTGPCSPSRATMPGPVTSLRWARRRPSAA